MCELKYGTFENLFEFKESIYYGSTKSVVETLLNYNIGVYSAGLKVAERKRKNLLPTTEFALWRHYNYFPEFPLTYSEALDFLRGKAYTPHKECSAEYLTATYKGVSLGLYKNIGRRFNNMFPSYWRI